MHRPKPTRSASSADLLTSLFLVLALAACGAGEPPPPADVYQVRGVVRQLPNAARGAKDLYVHHESIPAFKDADGEVVGMESMAMPFEVSAPEMLAGLEPGDKIGFDLEVHWEGGNPLLITRLEKLPRSTRLEFEPDTEESEDGESREP